MNCRRVRKLMPLYVEDDLQATVTARIASHLEWCGRCNWLADEYRESQGWLRSSTPPEFDKALLDSIKTGVLMRIAGTKRKPSLLALLAQNWSRRQVLALSAALLLVFGMIVVYVYQARVKVNSKREVLTKESRDERTQPEEPKLAGDPKQAPGANPRRRHRGSNTDRKVLARYREEPIMRESGWTGLSQFDEPAEAGAPLQPAGKSSSDFEDSTEMLRIEIQTSNPKIRIIWFAPRETDSHQSKPATD